MLPVSALYAGPAATPLAAATSPARRRWPWQQLLRDGLAWVLLLGVLLLAMPPGSGGPALGTLLVLMTAWVAGVYGNHLVLVPCLFDQGRYLAYAGALLAWVLVLHVVLRAVESTFFPVQYQATAALWFQPGLNLFGQMLLAMPFLFMWRAVVQRRQLLQGQLLAREQQLRLLEAQVNPHFLFNTLNSLYALSLTRSERTPDMLLALAELMRYQLESTRRPTVPLTEELAYLRSYAQLQEMRLGPRCPVQLELPAEAEATGLSITPLLLLALVENAFTHGTRRASGSFVHLRLAVAGPRLHLSIRNALPPPGAASAGAGTGLPNTRQRLALLYPGRHELQAGAGEEAFQTELIIEL